MKKLLAAAALALLAGCTTNRTYVTRMYQDPAVYQGITTESEKDNFRYALSVASMDETQATIDPKTENLPFIGPVQYQGTLKTQEFHLTPELYYVPYRFEPNPSFGIETRLGIGSEIQLKIKTYDYDLATPTGQINVDGPISTLHSNLEPFLSTALVLDAGYLSIFFQTRFNDDISFTGGAGLKW